MSHRWPRHDSHSERAGPGDPRDPRWRRLPAHIAHHGDHARPLNGAPEWIELSNPGGFGVSLEGWGIEHQPSSEGAPHSTPTYGCPAGQWNSATHRILDRPIGGWS